MIFTVKLSTSEALKMGKNETEYQVTIDVTKLSEKQRIKLNYYQNCGVIRWNEILNSNGELTTESIQALVDAEEKINEEKAKITESKILEWINKPDDQKIERGTIRSQTRILGLHDLPSDDPRVKKEKERLLKKCDEIEHEMYLKREAEIKRVKEADERKEAQLAGIVNAFGTEIQKKKWAAGMMERKEALEILWKNTFVHGAPIDTSNWVHSALENWDSISENADFNAKEIEKLTDEEFESLEHIKNHYPDFDIKLYKETCSDEENEFEGSVVYAEFSKQIGEYEMKANFVL